MSYEKLFKKYPIFKTFVIGAGFSSKLINETIGEEFTSSDDPADSKTLNKVANKLHEMGLLEKYKIWEEDYDHLEWGDFRENYFECSRCGDWDDHQCICYAR
jgi:hypothetical protein